MLVDTSLQLVDLERGDADVAIRFWSGSDPGLVSHRLFAEELSAYCSPALVRGENAITRLEDLERVTLLHWDLAGLPWAGGTRRWVGWAPWLHRLGAGHIRPGEGLRFSDYNLAIQAAIAGQGVMLGSLPLFRDLVAAGLLVRPFAESVPTDLGYDLVTTPPCRRPRRGRRLLRLDPRPGRRLRPSAQFPASSKRQLRPSMTITASWRPAMSSRVSGARPVSAATSMRLKLPWPTTT